MSDDHSTTPWRCSASSDAPLTDAIPPSAAFAACSIASARAFTTRRPSSNDIAPPKTSAEYSPSEKPAAAFT